MHIAGVIKKSLKHDIVLGGQHPERGSRTGVVVDQLLGGGRFNPNRTNQPLKRLCRVVETRVHLFAKT